MPLIDEAHVALLGAKPVSVVPSRGSEIQERQRTIDLRHDNLVRGFYYTLTGAAFFARDAVTERRYLQLRDSLLPDGLAEVKKSYSEEAGRGAVVRDHLKGEVKTTLSKLRTGEGTLVDYAGEWVEVAGRLGELEHEKAAAAAERPPADSQRVRSQWMKVAKAVLALFEVIDLTGPTAPRLMAVRDRLRHAARIRTTPSDGTGEATPEVEPVVLPLAANG